MRIIKLFFAIIFASTALQAQVIIQKKELPSQTGNAGKVLGTNGTTPSWVAIPTGTGGGVTPTLTAGSNVNINQLGYTYTISATTPTLSVVNGTLSGSYPTQTLTIPTQSLAPALFNTCNFRLTLTSGIPVTTGDVVNSNVIYFTPYNGNVISLYDGSEWKLLTSSEFSLSISSLGKGMYDIFCYSNSGTPTLETQIWSSVITRSVNLVYQDGILVKSGSPTRRYIGSFYNQGAVSSTVAISNASLAVISYSAHGLTANTPVVFTTTGTLPSGLSPNTTYYVASTGIITDNTFMVSATPGGAVIGTTTAGSGVHTCTVSAYTEDSQLNRYLWNNYNQVYKLLYRVESTFSWNYTTATRRIANGNNANRVNFIQGFDNIVECLWQPRVGNTIVGTAVNASIGLDDPTAVSFGSVWTLNNQYASSTVPAQGISVFKYYTGIGLHYLSANEYSTASGTTTWYGLTMKGAIYQ